MAAVVDDCGSNGFHEYAGKLDAKHEGKHVKVNPTQCAPRLTRPPPAAHRPELYSEGLAPLSRFARFVVTVTHTPKYCPQACENTQTARRTHSTHGSAPECAPAEGAPSLSIAVFRLTRASCRTSLPADLPSLLACPWPHWSALDAPHPMRPAVPSRVEAQARAEPSAGAQGPVLNEETTQAGRHGVVTAPDGLGWQSASAGQEILCRNEGAPRQRRRRRRRCL